MPLHAGNGGAAVASGGLNGKALGTYAMGIVHGLQPDAAFVVIPALALPTKLAAVAYCSLFVVGTVSAMGGYTMLIGASSEAISEHQPWLRSHLSTVASGVAIAVGALVLAAGMGMNVPAIL